MYFSKYQNYSDEFRLKHKQECARCLGRSIETNHGFCINCGCQNRPFMEYEKESNFEIKQKEVEKDMDKFVKSLSVKLHSVEEIFQLILKNFDEIINKT